MIVSVILIFIFCFLPVTSWAQADFSNHHVSNMYYGKPLDGTGASKHNAVNSFAVSAKPLRMYTVGTQSLSWKTSFSPYVVQAQVFFPVNCTVKCPVVIYSHGLGGTWNDFSYLAKMWASRGIITILLEHPGSDASVWRGKLRPVADLKAAYQLYWSGRDRAQMICFVIDQVDALSRTNDSLGKIMNSDKIGVAGNDLGALGALLVGGQLPPDNGVSLKNDRVKAVLALSPPVYTTAEMAGLVYANINVPFMSCGGTDDNGKIGTTKSFQRRIPFDSMARFDCYHITLYGADHLVYGGHAVKSRSGSDALYQKTIQHVTTVFWGAWLLDDSKALDLLSRDCPEIMLSIGKMEHGQNIQERTVQKQKTTSKTYY